MCYCICDWNTQINKLGFQQVVSINFNTYSSSLQFIWEEVVPLAVSSSMALWFNVSSCKCYSFTSQQGFGLWLVSTISKVVIITERKRIKAIAIGKITKQQNKAKMGKRWETKLNWAPEEHWNTFKGLCAFCIQFV